MKNDFAAAMGVITAGNETVHSKQEHEVMNFFRDEGVFVRDSKKRWQALAMIERGLIMHADKPCLTCLHHPRQLWGFGACVSHFTETKGHKNEKPELDELATMLEKKHDDETADGTASLLHYFGDAVLNIMNRLNWRKGQKLGAHKPHDRAPAPVRTIFSPETQPEMFDRLAHTLGQAQLMKERGGDLQGRLKRDRTGKKIAEVPFCLTEIAESSFPALNWHQIARALVSMTEYAFSKTGHVHVYDDKLDMQALDDIRQERFFWTLTHVKLSMLTCLPQDLQAGFVIAGNGPVWTETMRNLMQYGVYDWSLVGWKQEYLRLIGRLWKTLEVAMSACDLELAFCVFSAHRSWMV